MRFNPERCPECAERAVAVIETLLGRAELEQGEDGSYEYDGYTDMLWDSQVMQKAGPDPAKPQYELWCDGNHDWLAELVKEEPSGS